MSRVKLLTAAAVVIGLFPMPSLATSTPVSREMMKDQWPFSITAGVLGCEGQSVTLRANGHTYAINGSAKTQGKKLGWRDVREIWKDNPEIPGTKMDIGPMINKGLLLCK